MTMWRFGLASVLLLVAVSPVINGEEVPEYLHICTKSDPQIGQCMINTIHSLRPKLAEGIPELEIPSLEPLDLGDLLVSEQNPQNGLSITAKQIKAYGASDFKIKKLDVIEFGRTYKLLLHLPHLYVEGRYDINGRVLLLPIKGQGKFTGNFTRCVADVVMNTEPRVINGAEHIVLKKLNILVKVGKGTMNLDNLFNGDKTLGDVVNETINQNFDTVSKDIIPLIERALERSFRKTGNKILGRYTQSQLFPET